jgi:hypothetical protein
MRVADVEVCLPCGIWRTRRVTALVLSHPLPSDLLVGEGVQKRRGSRQLCVRAVHGQHLSDGAAAASDGDRPTPLRPVRSCRAQHGAVEPASSPRSARQLVGENVRLADLRWRRQEVFGVSH